jgi:uncharacterized damage-inducible protein DinB
LGEEESMQIRELLVPEFDFEMKKIRSTLERVPETKVEYKPHEKSMAIGKLAAHLARIPSWIVPIVDLPELDVATSGDTPQVMESSAKLLQGFDEHVRQARSALNKLEDTSLADPWKLLSKGTILIQGTRYQMIRSLVLNHAIHHRGQLGVYLRLNNVAVPSIYGPSADES